MLFYYIHLFTIQIYRMIWSMEQCQNTSCSSFAYRNIHILSLWIFHIVANICISGICLFCFDFNSSCYLFDIVCWSLHWFTLFMPALRVGWGIALLWFLYCTKQFAFYRMPIFWMHRAESFCITANIPIPLYLYIRSIDCINRPEIYLIWDIIDFAFVA